MLLAWIAAALLPASAAAGCAVRQSEDVAPTREVVTPETGGSTAVYSAAVHTGDLLFLSGVVGSSDASGIGGATRQALDGVRDRAAAAGATMADLVQCTVYLTEIDDYGAMNEAYVSYFPSEPPARTAIAVAAVPAEADLEIACIAVIR